MLIFLVLILLFFIFILVTSASHAFVFKFNKYKDSLWYFIWNNDIPEEFHGSNCIRVGTLGPQQEDTQKIRIVFIRHGQSVWNSVYNEKNRDLPFNIVRTLLLEIRYFFTQPLASGLIDSPLSAEGIQQSKELANFMQGAEGRISFDTSTSVILCSNLRRTMQTALIGLDPRLKLSGEKIVVNSALQEGSRFIDTHSFSSESGKMAPMTFPGFEDPAKVLNMFDARLNKGNKSIETDLNGRSDIFLSHTFGGTIVPAISGENGAKNLNEIIVVGHSIFFRNFFKRFLPRNSSHIAKKYKMENCAVVAFDLIRNVSTGEVVIDENSIKPLYKGFIKT
ncbi:unnamed protein product [Phytomonas sp. Hart1]|nr:unnamed protein product [Phytomonas sp. Hart1]|eukprot:CCW68971.1 unnamed protein product [Phytomonas sp. isolate Hart1]